MRLQSFVLAASLLALCSCADNIVRLGEPLPAWEEGNLDIHMISTGRGESTFLILPDGTTFLVDAGGVVTANTNPGGQAPFVPNEDISVGKAIVDYINHFSPAVSAGHINYFLATHHHGDHMGAYSVSLPDHESGLFKLTSVCEVGSELVMDKIFDRDYPDFSYPTEATGAMMNNYKAFLDWTAEANGTAVEKWRVGVCDQVVPVNGGRDVSVRSYAGNAYFWTGGEDGETFTLMPTAEEYAELSAADRPDENCFSCAFILSYGKFDYFNGGDLQFAFAGDDSETVPQPFWDTETPLAKAVHKVEVMEANHHGCTGTQAEALINKLAPEVWLVGTWNRTGQPNKKSTRRVIEANPNCEIFSTYQSDANLERLADEIGQGEVDRHVVGRYGHIVVRVAPHGDSYMVYTLEDSNEEYVVKSIHGPYVCGD